MQTRRIGDLDVSLVGIGCNNFGGRMDLDQTRLVVDTALDEGITLFDTADVYGGTRSEELLGQALGDRRDRAVIATKFGSKLDGDPARAGASPGWVRQAAEDSLRRLGTDTIDLYQIHRPDDATPIADTLGALAELIDAGKVRHIGCSNFSSAQLEEAMALTAEGLPGFVTIQNHWNLLHREPETDGVQEAARRHGVGFLPYFPLASGLLTGKYLRDQPPPDGTRLAGMPGDRRGKLANDAAFDIVERLTSYAAQHDRTVTDVAIAWLASQDVTASVIAGATKPEQVRANAAAGAWRLDASQRDEVGRLAATTSPR